MLLWRKRRHFRYCEIYKPSFIEVFNQLPCRESPSYQGCFVFGIPLFTPAIDHALRDSFIQGEMLGTEPVKIGQVHFISSIPKIAGSPVINELHEEIITGFTEFRQCQTPPHESHIPLCSMNIPEGALCQQTDTNPMTLDFSAPMSR